MRLSRYFMPVLKENPSEAQIVSHRLMLRAGMAQREVIVTRTRVRTTNWWAERLTLLWRIRSSTSHSWFRTNNAKIVTSSRPVRSNRKTRHRHLPAHLLHNFPCNRYNKMIANTLYLSTLRHLIRQRENGTPVNKSYTQSSRQSNTINRSWWTINSKYVLIMPPVLMS